jgi:PelA/Pel-15E family pectate lyase
MTTLTGLSLIAALLQPGPTADEAQAALDRAVDFMATEVACEGGYLWRYSEDLTVFEGEGPATATHIWIQPPGTPAVGMAYYEAWRLLGDPTYLDAAQAAGRALVEAQLACGGWDYHFNFDPDAADDYYTLLDSLAGADPVGRNQGTMDDNNTQSALLCLAWLSATEPDPAFGRAIDAAVDFFLEAQMDNGAWPQRYPDPMGYAAYPTFNDATINDIMKTLKTVGDLTGRTDAHQAVLRAGEFILLSQGEPPQAGWAQQYDENLEPAWARKFEPPAWCPAVTARNINTLIDLYHWTGEERWLEPIPEAIDWLETCRLEDGRWPRFVEPGTNDPLYFTSDYDLVKTDDDLPTHYSFQGTYGIPAAIERYRRTTEHPPTPPPPAEVSRVPEPTEPAALEYVEQHADSVTSVIAAQDERGVWVEDGWIECRTMIRNMQELAAYVWAAEGLGE